MDKEIRRLTTNELKELQKVLLVITKDIFKFCKLHNLVCMMAGGSLLGTIRDKCFIPWDDDVDLMMPREDYEKFIKLFRKEGDSKYLLTTASEKNNAICMFTRVGLKNTYIGNPFLPDCFNLISVDIFPIDYVPESKKEDKKINKRSYKLRKISCAVAAYEGRNKKTREISKMQGKKNFFIYKISLLVGFLYSYRKASNWYYLFDQTVKNSNKTNVMVIGSGSKKYIGERVDSKLFETQIEVPFEDTSVYVPVGYDEYLKLLYKDYMKLPPKEKQVSFLHSGFYIGDYNG